MRVETLKNYNALVLTKKYNGEGDRRITEFSLITNSLVDAEKEVISYLKDSLEKLQII